MTEISGHSITANRILDRLSLQMRGAISGVLATMAVLIGYAMLNPAVNVPDAIKLLSQPFYGALADQIGAKQVLLMYTFAKILMWGALMLIAMRSARRIWPKPSP